MKTETLLDVFKRNQYNLKASARKSQDWFEQQVNLIRRQGVTPNRVMKSQSDTLTATIIPGNMYMFFYDAKHKDTLPYWDRFPLLLPYKKTPDGFMGLNMHYLPYQFRVQLLDKLTYFATNKNMDETTRIKYSWALIDGVSKFRAAQPCIKQYLSEHVKSPFKKVIANDWATAMMLPVEQFVGANKQQVWQDSKRIMRK
jgi:hypothetical protein